VKKFPIRLPLPESPLWRFVLLVLLWLAPAFLLWHLVVPWHAALAGLLAKWGISLFLPELILQWGWDGEQLAFVTSLLSETSEGQRGNLQVGVNPRLYTWSAALYLALALASRTEWSSVPLALAILLPLQAWGVAFNLLVQVGISMDAAVTAQVGLSGLTREAVALGYQFGILILPPLSPIVVWAAFDSKLLMRLSRISVRQRTDSTG
jgi:hypothetical protein